MQSLAELKLKANQFIEDYERQVTERQYQKQKLKQNIMLEIMSNRHKSQTSQSNSQACSRVDSVTSENKIKGSNVVAVSQHRHLGSTSNGHEVYVRSNSVPNAFNSLEEDTHTAEITFKQKNRPDIDTYDEGARKQDVFDEEKNEPSDQQIVRESQKFNKSKISPYTYGQKSNKFQKQVQQNLSKPQRFKMKQPQVAPESEEERQIQEQQIQDKKGPIFLTMDEDESMQISQHNNNKKGYVFDINMNSNDPNDDIQEMRKRKIEDMEKKRQQRLQDFRKQQQIKQIRKSNSSLKRTVKSSIHNGSKISDDNDSQIPKSKSRNKIDSDKDIKTTHQSVYGAKPPQPERQRQSYMIPAQDFKRNDSNRQYNNYQQTPKTVNSEYHVDKSKGKKNIFRGESPKRLDKSASKYLQQPKIQPKQRKNTLKKHQNKKLMITALNTVCLPGELNRKQREKLTQVIERQESGQFFVFLFKEYSRNVVKAIYVLDSSQTYLSKIYGEKSPHEIVAQNVQRFYRFDSGSKSFVKMDGCKSFSLVVHAIQL